MKLPSLFLICAGLVQLMVPSSQNAFFIPIPSSFAPTTTFGCPDAGTVFTYDVRAWNTNRPNRMIAVGQDQLNCRITSDAQGTYDWFGGVGPRLADDAEKALITGLWPLRPGYTGKASDYNLPSRFSEIEYMVTYGLAVVPAGVFWVYKIRKNYYWQNSLCYTTTLWWSPLLKWTILQWPEQPGRPSRTGGLNWGLVSVSS
jgi:hypothetical protein